MMIQLSKSLNAWGAADFRAVLQADIEALSADELLLQQGLSQGSYSSDKNLTVMIIKVSEEAACIRAKAGIFYASIIGGCSCADDPTPIDEIPEYCVLQIDINKQTAEARITLLPE